jgi:hypothetical protein
MNVESRRKARDATGESREEGAIVEGISLHSRPFKPDMRPGAQSLLYTSHISMAVQGKA